MKYIPSRGNLVDSQFVCVYVHVCMCVCMCVCVSSCGWWSFYRHRVPVSRNVFVPLTFSLSKVCSLWLWPDFFRGLWHLGGKVVNPINFSFNFSQFLKTSSKSIGSFFSNCRWKRQFVSKSLSTPLHWAPRFVWWCHSGSRGNTLWHHSQKATDLGLEFKGKAAHKLLKQAGDKYP